MLDTPFPPVDHVLIASFTLLKTNPQLRDFIHAGDKKRVVIVILVIFS